MKVLVFVHDLGVGGSQLNAIELAREVQENGHDVIVFGPQGPLVDTVQRWGLEFIPAPVYGRRPSGTVVGTLAGLAKSRRLDILHGYEWPPALECCLAAARAPRTVAVATVMSMRIAPFIPKHVPLAVGTELLAESERNAGRTSVSLLEPPVDTNTNKPGLELGQIQFRNTWGLTEGTYVVAMVSRLAHELKLEGILSAMEATSRLTATLNLSLVIAGDGPARGEVAKRAAEINQRTGRKTVILTGELTDPRPLYDIADVCLGMGGSALRSMAFAKPLVVQGEGGFWVPMTPATMHTFLRQGWFGQGRDPAAGADRLSQILADLLPATHLRAELGTFGQRLVGDRFSLGRAGERQLDIYARALAHRHPPVRRHFGNLAAAGSFAIYESRRLTAKFAGLEKSDDFNARPLTEPADVNSALRSVAHG